MTVTYRTFILEIPATEPVLLPARTVVEHWCNQCHQQIPGDELVAHYHDCVADRWRNLP